METFRDAYCRQSNVSKDAFEEKVLLACLPRIYWLPGLIVLHLTPSYFEPSMIMLRSLARHSTLKDFMSDLNYYHNQKTYIIGFRRKFLHFRLSGRRLIRLGQQLLPEK